MPVPVTTFSPIATGGVAQQPITSFNYENIGVNIDITPRTHHDGQVSLALKILVSSISGTGFGDLPTFGNREINTVIRLQDGETNLLAGLIRDNERRVLEGIPGPQRHAAGRPPVRAQPPRDAGIGHRPDADAAHRPGAGPDEDDLRPFRVGRAGAARRRGCIDLPVVLERRPRRCPSGAAASQATAPPAEAACRRRADPAAGAGTGAGAAAPR